LLQRLRQFGAILNHPQHLDRKLLLSTAAHGFIRLRTRLVGAVLWLRTPCIILTLLCIMCAAPNYNYSVPQHVTHQHNTGAHAGHHSPNSSNYHANHPHSHGTMSVEEVGILWSGLQLSNMGHYRENHPHRELSIIQFPLSSD
jgi:hypothetical protein